MEQITFLTENKTQGPEGGQVFSNLTSSEAIGDQHLGFLYRVSHPFRSIKKVHIQMKRRHKSEYSWNLRHLLIIVILQIRTDGYFT